MTSTQGDGNSGTSGRFSDHDQIQILAAEVRLLHEFIVKRLGVRVLNVHSAYYKGLHASSDEMDRLVRSLDSGAAARILLTPPGSPLHMPMAEDDNDNWNLQEADTLVMEPMNMPSSSISAAPRPIPGCDMSHTCITPYPQATTTGESRSQSAYPALPLDAYAATRTPTSTEMVTIEGSSSSRSRSTTQTVIPPTTRTRQRQRDKNVGKNVPMPVVLKVHKNRKRVLTAVRARANRVPGTVARVRQKNAAAPNEIHECRYCKAAFTSHFAVVTHEAIHTIKKKEFSFQCDYEFCDRTFAHRCNKIRHERIHLHAAHTGEKENQNSHGFRCQQCGKTFTRLAGLRKHKRTRRACAPEMTLSPILPYD